MSDSAEPAGVEASGSDDMRSGRRSGRTFDAFGERVDVLCERIPAVLPNAHTRAGASDVAARSMKLWVMG
nr:hypothetical protein GCM10020241_06790 [Streptoalloteichus tenebrarius]